MPHNVEVIQRGIYSLDGHDPGNPHRLVIAVHPYYAWEYHPEDYKAVFPKGYLARFEKLVKHHRGPVITMEEKDNINRTASKYLALGRKKDRFLIATEKCGTMPASTGWEEVIGFIKRFKGTPVGLAGGYYWPDKDNPSESPGCLGDVLERLERAHIPAELIPSLVYK